MNNVFMERGFVGVNAPVEARKFQVAAILRKFVGVLFLLYAMSLTCSMAGMEIFSWATGAFFIAYAISKRMQGIEFYKLGIEIPLLILFVVAILGLRLNAPDGNFIYAIGRLRNFFLIYLLTYCFQSAGDIKKFVLVILSFATIISVYGIWQHYSGVDLWRHDHRALVLIPWTTEKLYSTVGFFNHHLTYAHSYAMILCIPWAILLVMGKKLKPWQAAFMLVSFLLIGTSVLFTYGRGAWLALILSLPLMAGLVHRRFCVSILLLIAVVGSVLYNTDKTFHDRASSVFSDDYKSNEERKKLWEANIEMFREHPFIGVGMVQNEARSNMYYEKLGITGGMAGHAHNNYFEFLATTGIIGFLCYLFIMGFLLFKSLKLYWALPSEETWKRAIVLAAIGAQITFHLGGLTQSNFNDFKVQHQLFFWFAVVLSMSHALKASGSKAALESPA